MAWLAPAALVGLLAVAGPILVHLLRRRQARRVIVPSVRFVIGSDESAVRAARISDAGLLALRIGIIAAAVLALARPLLFTGARERYAAERIARAVVIDASASIRGAITADAISAQVTGADAATTVESRDVGAGLTRAIAWLAQAPPSRREAVVLSDFQLGALTERDIADVPRDVGLRFVRIARPQPPDERPPVRLISGGNALSGELAVDLESTAVTYRFEAPSWAGLQILADPNDADGVALLRRMLGEAGVHAPVADRPVTVRFGGRAKTRAGESVRDGWPFEVGQRLLQTIRRLDVPVDVTSTDGSLIIDVGADPGSLAALRVTAAALGARLDPETFTELEPGTLSDEVLTEWSREPAPPAAIDWTRTDSSDGRFFWTLALVLLGIESLVRTRTGTTAERVESHAA